MVLSQADRGSRILELDLSNIPMDLKVLESFKKVVEGLSSL